MGAIEVYILNGPSENAEFFVPCNAEKVAERNRPEARRRSVHGGGNDRTTVEAANEKRTVRCPIPRDSGEQCRAVRTAEDHAYIMNAAKTPGD